MIKFFGEIYGRNSTGRGYLLRYGGHVLALCFIVAVCGRRLSEVCADGEAFHNIDNTSDTVMTSTVYQYPAQKTKKRSTVCTEPFTLYITARGDRCSAALHSAQVYCTVFSSLLSSDAAKIIHCCYRCTRGKRQLATTAHGARMHLLCLFASRGDDGVRLLAYSALCIRCPASRRLPQLCVDVQHAPWCSLQTSTFAHKNRRVCPHRDPGFAA